MNEDDKSDLETLEFNALNFQPDALVDACVEIFRKLGLDDKLNIRLEALRSFVLCVHGRMLENPYHCWHHVVDVTQASLVLYP